MGLATVRTLGEKVAERIVTERTAHGPFADLRDLVRRVDLSTAQLEALATGGALESPGARRCGRPARSRRRGRTPCPG
jgi:error-prone DNA polymerase